MKTCIFSLLLVWCISFFWSCDNETDTDFPLEIIQNPKVSDSIFQLLLDDAKLICLSHYSIEEMYEMNEIAINETHIAPIVSALQMLHLDTTSTIVAELKQYKIHALCPVQLYQSILTGEGLDANLNNWLHSGISNNSYLNELIEIYNLKLDSIGEGKFLVSSFEGINHYALATELQKFPFAHKASAVLCSGDGSQIEITQFSPDFIHLIYSYGWGDCPSGCIYRHYWEVGIHGSGLLNPVEKSGNLLPR